MANKREKFIIDNCDKGESVRKLEVAFTRSGELLTRPSLHHGGRMHDCAVGNTALNWVG